MEKVFIRHCLADILADAVQRQHGQVSAASLPASRGPRAIQGGPATLKLPAHEGYSAGLEPDGKVTRRSDVPPDMLGEITKEARPDGGDGPDHAGRDSVRHAG